MTLKSPSTYGEWYWKQSVDAQKEFDEAIEEAMSPLLSGLLADIPEIKKLPTGVRNLLDTLVAPKSAGLAGFLTASAGEFASETLRDAIGPAMAMLKREVNRRSRETWLTAQQAVTLSQRKKIPDEYFYLLTASEGYEDIAADSLYTSLAPYPTIPEIMTWARYHGDYDNVKTTVWEKFNVPTDDFQLWEWLSWQKLTSDQVLTLFKRGKYTDVESLAELGRIGWDRDDRNTLLDIAYTLPNSMLMVQGDLIQEASSETILRDISKGDIHPDYAEQYLDAILTKPSTEDIVSYELRRDPDLSNLSKELRKTGIHPHYHELYRELAQQIPPVADIITMAVREAFSPDIAARFGQYEDFPPEFAEWAAKKGLSKEWSERYWAAHWALPSPQQGFEMLHRGVITNDELNLLLRAQDVMPFWREKLVKIAYRVLSRVDIRRMFKLGVLNEDEVNDSYKNMGYDEGNAKRMTDFTIKQTRESLARFTTTDIVRSFVNRYISESEAMSLIRDLGIKDSDANYVISTARYKRDWDFKDDQISGIANLYKKKIIEEDECRSRLSNLRLPSDEIDVLLQKWTLRIEVEVEPTWTTSQTLSFLKKGLIDRDRAMSELRLMGYNEERIAVYLAIPTT